MSDRRPPEVIVGHSLVTCVKKRRYHSLDYAETVADRMRRTCPGPWEFRAYYCALCDGYHVGRIRTGGGTNGQKQSIIHGGANQPD